MNITFSVLGEPQGKGRPRFSAVAGHTQAFTPKQTVLYENLIKTEYRRQIGTERFADDDMLVMCVRAYYSIPASASKRKRQDMLDGRILPTKKPDCDNVLKVVADSLNQITYRDDAQIVTATILKLYSEQPRIEISIESYEQKLEVKKS